MEETPWTAQQPIKTITQIFYEPEMLEALHDYDKAQLIMIAGQKGHPRVQ